MKTSSMIPISKPQRFPSDWQLALNEVPIPTEEELLGYRDDMSSDFWSYYSLGIDTRALTFAIMHAFDRISLPPPTLKTKSAGLGAFNDVRIATFPACSCSSNGEEELTAAIRIPYKASRVPGRIEPTVALMTFAREYLGMPVPKVYAWNDSDGEDITENPVNAPYIIMEYAPGERALPHWFNTPDEDHWYKMLDACAKGYANLAKPLPLAGYGSIYFAQGEVEDLTKIEAYRLGPFMPGPMVTDDRYIGPYRMTDKLSLVEFWTMLWETEVDYVKRRHEGNLDMRLKFEDNDEETDDSKDTRTLADFLITANHLLDFIQHCPLPTDPRLYEPCIVPMDYALRNITIDPISFEITSFLDWDDSAILPFILCSRFVDEIREEPGDTKEWFEEEGGFRFLPPEEKENHQGETQDLLKKRVDYLKSKEKMKSGARETVEVAKKNHDCENRGEEDNGEKEEEVPKAQSGEREGESGPALPSSDDIEKAYRRWRLIDTHFQREYMKLLEGHDERFAIPGFWKAREDALKIHYLMACGWVLWMQKSNWIKRRAEIVTGRIAQSVTS